MRKDLQQLIDQFLHEGEFVKKIRPQTLRGYVNVFKLFMKLMPNIALDSISSDTIIAFFKILQERKRFVGKGILKIGIRKSTVATYWSKLNTFCIWLKNKDCLIENPFDKLPYPTPIYDEKKYLRKQEVEKIITAIYTHHDNNILILKRNLVLFYLLLFCGLRREELILLQIRDFDFEKKLLTIRADTSKSGSTRTVPLHSICITHLKDYLAARIKYTTPYLIVSSTRDEKLSIDGLKHFVNRVRKHSGIEFHLHQFRHTFAVNFLKSSNNIAKLKQLLGHRSINMTMIYLRCLPPDELRGDIENMAIDKLI